MLVVCDQCKARYKITIAKSPGKAVTFKCGKCQNLIRLSPEQIEAGSGPATGVRPAVVKPSRTEPTAPAATPPEDAETVRGNCLKCGAAFVKPVTDKSPICYQCRIDSLVNKVREKYGVAETPAESAPETPAAAPEPEAPAEPAAEPRYTVRSADGLVLGPIKFRTVAVLAREKRIGGREEVAKDDGEFAPLMSYPELAELFPGLKEILDTDGLEDKVDEAFMAAFGADEGEGKAERDAAETEADLAGLGQTESSPAPAEEPTFPEPETPPAPDETAPEPPAEEPGLGIDDLGAEAPEPEASPEPEPPAEAKKPAEETVVKPPAESEPSEPAPPAPEPAPEDDSVEVEKSFRLNDPTPGPRRAVELREADAAAKTTSGPEAPARIVEKKPDLVAPSKPAPADDVGTEFDVGEEWSGEDEEAGAEDEEVIEDLEAIEPPPDARYRIRYPDGLMLGPVKFGTIKELFKTGNLTGQEDVQRDDHEWGPFTDLPELAVLVAEAEPIVEDDVVELTDLLEEK